MPQVFLSYARDDLAPVERLQAVLEAAGIGVWRDQQSLYAGQAWPKALGEAIAASDAVVLCWSEASAASHFVEAEWTTALALKRPLVPWLLDAAALPAALRALNAITSAAPAEAGAAVQRALAGPAEAPSAEAQRAVLGRLEALPEATPEQVAEAARAVFRQEGWQVQGSVYQITGGTVQIGEAEAPAARRRTTRLAVAVGGLGVLAAILLGVFLWEPLQQMLREQPRPLPLAGQVLDEASEPLAGVVVSFRLGEVAYADTTDAAGRFAFEVLAADTVQVRLTAQKDGYQTHRGDPYLATTNYSFLLRRP